MSLVDQSEITAYQIAAYYARCLDKAEVPNLSLDSLKKKVGRSRNFLDSNRALIILSIVDKQKCENIILETCPVGVTFTKVAKDVSQKCIDHLKNHKNKKHKTGKRIVLEALNNTYHAWMLHHKILLF